VTTLGSTRDDPASDGDRGAEERADDPERHAMRAVWLAMRDEDPPERGLAELLAAARAKADAMQVRPALWQRVIAGLRRPPPLACAAVLVLVVGGAVILGGRGLDGPAPARAPAVSRGMTTAPAAPARAAL
jgi:hypothetical protein